MVVSPFDTVGRGLWLDEDLGLLGGRRRRRGRRRGRHRRGLVAVETPST